MQSERSPTERFRAKAAAKNKPKKVSFPPTAIQTYCRCRRKYFYESVLDFRKPQSDSQIKGELFHAQIEEYFRSGTYPTEQRVIESLKNLPKPGCFGARVEQAFALDIDAERWIRAKSDLKYYQAWEDGDDPAYRIPHVIDHKSSKDPDKWGKSPEELAGDIQVNIYAYKALLDDPEAQEVLVSHHYIATEGPIRSWLTTVEEPLCREEVETNFKNYLKIIDNMTETRKCTHVSQVPADGRDNGACKEFGGCHVKDKCDTLIFMGLRKDTPKMSNDPRAALKAKLAHLQAGTAPVASSPAAAAEGKRSTGVKRQAAPEPVEETEETQDELIEEVIEETPPPPPPTKRQSAKPAPKAEPPPPAPEPDPEPATGPILLINCVAQAGVEQVALETWLAPYIALIEEQTGKNLNAISFREGIAMLEQCIEAAEDLPEALIIDARSYLGSNCIPALMRRNPQAVFRGIG